MKRLGKTETGRRLESGKKTGWSAGKSPEYTRLHTSARWQKARAFQLMSFPFCEIRNCGRIAEEVHRMNPKDYDIFFELSNLRSLCKRHHKEIGRLLKMKQDTLKYFNERTDI